LLGATVAARILQPLYPFSATVAAPEMPFDFFSRFFKPDYHDADWKNCSKQTPYNRIAPAAVCNPATYDRKNKGYKDKKRCRRKDICQLNNLI